MIPSTLTPNDINVPDSNEFISTFGCDYEVDNDLYQQYIFQDSYGSKLRLTFGLIDNSFGLSLWKNDSQIFKIYDEFLLNVSIDSDSAEICIDLKQADIVQKITLSVWPVFLISIERVA